MLYKFKSKSAADLIMLGPDGDALMRLLGRQPSAQGIIEAAALPAALAALEQALKDESKGRVPAAQDPQAARAVQPPSAAASDENSFDAAVSLRQRLWPMIEMLRRSNSAGQPVVWGV